jgi:predicted TIM-barrel fold metal-dependent hydrolase
MNDDAITIVDTHQHLWDQSRLSYPWTAGLAPLNRSFLPEEYARETAGTGIAKAVFVECDAAEEHMAAEAAWACSLGGLTAGVVASCRPEHDGFAAYLDRIAHTKLKGVRRVLHTQPDALSTSSTFRANVSRLGPRGLTFDLCVLAKQLPAGLEFVRACPGTTFVLDHCGVPEVKGRALDPWRQHVKQLSAEPNVAACKVSGLVAYADAATWTLDDLRPFVDHVAECFGPDRLVFGGDWPVCTLTCSLAKWVDAAKQLTASWPAEHRVKLFRTNAERVYRV